MNIIRTVREERCYGRRPKDLLETMESIIRNEIYSKLTEKLKKNRTDDDTKSAAPERHKISKTHKLTRRIVNIQLQFIYINVKNTLKY